MVYTAGCCDDGLSQLIVRLSAIMKFGAGDDGDPFIRANSLITDLINKLQFIENVVDVPVVAQRTDPH